MNLNKIILGLMLCISTAFAIDPVSNLSVSSPHNGGSKYNTPITFTWTKPDSVAKYYYVLDTNSSNYDVQASSNKVLLNSASATSVQLTAPSSGDYYFHIIAVDSGDSTSIPKVTATAVTIDLDAGTVSVSPDGGAISEATSVSLTKSETGTIYYTTDGSTPSTSSSTYSSALNIAVGMTLKTFLVDTATNEGTIVTKVFTSSINPTLIANGETTTVDGTVIATSNTNGATPKTALTVGGDGFTRYKYSVNDGDEITNTVATTIDLSSATFETSKAYTVSVKGGDAYSFEETATDFTFTVDNDAPTSLVATDTDDNTDATKLVYSGNFTLKTLSATDSVSNTASLVLKYTTDGSTDPKVAGSTYDGSQISIDTASISDGTEGTKILKFYAQDEVGNQSDTKTVTYTIDKKIPVLTMPDAQSFSDIFTVSMSFDDDDNSSTTDTGTIKYLHKEETCKSTMTVDELTKTYSDAIQIKDATTQLAYDADVCLYAVAVDEAGNYSDFDNATSGAQVSYVQFSYSANTITLNLLKNSVSGDALVDGDKFATVSTYGARPVSQIRLTLTSSESDHNYKYKLNSDAFSAEQTYANSDSSDIISLTSLSDGENNVTVNAYNTSSDSNTTVSFTVDNTPPVDYNATSDVNFKDTNWTTDESLIVSLDIPADATTLSYALTSTDVNATSFTASTTSPTVITIPSTKKLTVKLIDEVGNESNSSSVLFTQVIPQVTKSHGAGWHMISLPTGTISDAGLSSNKVWSYSASSWKSDANITSTSISQGYWVKLTASKDIIYQGSDTSTSFAIPSSSNTWELKATSSAISDSSLVGTNILVWTYTNGVWKFKTTISGLETTLTDLGYGQISTIDAYQAYWIYKK